MIEKINHYSIENPASVYDEEAMTALELAGRTAAKVNESVSAFNKLEESIPGQIAANVSDHIKDGSFDKQIDAHTAELTEKLSQAEERMTASERNMVSEIGRMTVELQNTENDLTARVDNLILNAGGDSSAEVVDARNGYATLGTYLRKTFATLPVGADYVTGNLDMNTLCVAGTHVVSSDNIVNGPTGWYEGVSLVKVEGYGILLAATGYQQHGIQFITNLKLSKARMRRFTYNQEGSLYFGEWLPVGMECVLYTDSSTSVNQLVETGEYLFAGGNFADAPTSSSFTLDVKNFNGWPTQICTELWSSNMWFRSGRANPQNSTNFAPDLVATWNPWKKVAGVDDIEATIGEISSTQGNAGYTIVNFGDSIFAAEQGATSVSNFLALATGATVVNGSFGGCHMSTHWGADWTPFSMWKLADAVATGDFTEQHTKATAGVEGMPNYFDSTVTAIENTDFSTVDLVTIAYGTNDFSSSDAVDGTNKYDVATFGGALRYSIERLLNAYPNLRIILVAPCWRCWLDDNGDYIEDSDTKIFTGGSLLRAFVEKTIEIAGEYHLPVVNPYDHMGINKFNYEQWTSDGTHPTETGRKQLAKIIANTVRGM